MPTIRTPIRRGQTASVTAEMVRLFRRCIEIEADGLADVDEDEGGRRQEHAEAVSAFHAAISFKPWEISPLVVANLVAINDGEPGAAAYRKAIALRRQLEGAAT